MKIVINNPNNEYIENIFFENLDNIDETFKFAIDTANIALAPRFDLLPVPSKFINILSTHNTKFVTFFNQSWE